MPDVRLTLDREPRVAPEGTTVEDLVRDHGPADAVAVRVDEARDAVDLSHVVADGDRLETVVAASEEGRAVLRHSTAHVMAQAVTDLYEGAKFAIGPPVENGFYYDFDIGRPFTPEDVERVERRMREIVKSRQTFRRRPLSADEARETFVDQPFKLEVVDRAAAGTVDAEEAVDAAAGEITVYDNVGRDGEQRWTDLCRGPHVPSTGHLGAFRLLRTAAAYWRGDERNPQLQRIYGTAWETRDALKEHLRLLEEAERRDHRRLGVELDLFSFPPVLGGGLAVWHPRGAAVRRVMEEHSRRRHEEAGYEHVYSPHVAKEPLFATSGHLEWYREGMYPALEMDGADYFLKPMNCPFHVLVYAAQQRSYRDLPLRMFELGTVYRYERSGVLHGLTRARGFTQDDAHLFVTPGQLADELTTTLQFILSMLADFGLTEFEAELATRPDKRVGSEEQWDTAEAALRGAVEAAGVAYVVAEGEGAFYAPKLDVHVRDAIGRRWQMSTLQVDFQLPERFDLTYVAPDGSQQRPYMIHRALFGSVERFFAILLENYAGAMPAWLSPVQVVGVPVADDHVAHLADVVERLRAVGVRAEVDDSDDRMQKKIRTAARRKVPFVLIAGDDDVAAGAVSFRYRDGSQRNGVAVDQAVADVLAACASGTRAGNHVDDDEGTTAAVVA